MSDSDLEIVPGQNRFDRLIIAVGNIISFFYLLCAAIIMWEVIARYVFNAPTFWAHETTTLISALLLAFGGTHCLAKKKHIRIILVYDAVPASVRRWLDVIISILSMIFAAGLTWGSWIMVQKSIFTPQGAFRLETSGSAWDPPFPAITKMFLFAMLTIMLIQMTLHLFHHLFGARDD